MPELTHYVVDVSIVTRVRDAVTGRPLVGFNTHGQSEGDSAQGLSHAIAPALANALAEGAVIADNYRKGDTDAALRTRAGR